jgi:hypothetical protein
MSTELTERITPGIDDDVVAVVLSFLDPYYILHTVSLVSIRWNKCILPNVWQDISYIPPQFTQEFSKKCTNDNSLYWKALSVHWSRHSLRWILMEQNIMIQLPPFLVNWRLYIQHDTISFDTQITMQATPSDTNTENRHPITLNLSASATNDLLTFAEELYPQNDTESIILSMLKPLPWNKHVILTDEMPLLIPNLVQVHGVCHISQSTIAIQVYRFQLVDAIQTRSVDLNEDFEFFTTYGQRHELVPNINSYVGCMVTGHGFIDPTFREKAPISICVQTKDGDLPMTLHYGDEAFRSKIGLNVGEKEKLNVIENVPMAGFSHIKFRGKLLSSNLDVGLDRVDLIRVGIHGPNIFLCIACIMIFGWIMTQGWILSREYSAILGALQGYTVDCNWMKTMLLWVRFAVTVPLTVVPGFLACLGISGLCSEISSVIRQFKYRARMRNHFFFT